MGWLNLFKREVPEPSFEFDELERIFGNLQLKSLSIDKAAEFVARIFARSEFKFIENGKKKATDWDYLLNVRPNKNESASEFWQKAVYRLLTKNEVLIFLTNDDQLLIADSYIRQKYAVFDDTFTSVSCQDYTFQKPFKMNEVIFLQYNNNRLQEYFTQLFNDYEKLHTRLVEALARNNQIRGVLSTRTNASFDESKREKMQRYADGLFKSFTTKTVAIVPAQEGMEYSELTNTTGTSNLSVDELKKLRRQFDDEVADILGIPTALMHGDMANLENSQKMFNSYCYQSLVKKMSDGLNFALLSKNEYKDNKRLVIIGEGQRDKFSLAQSIDKLISSGSMLINEVREELGLEAVPWGDKPLITKNYQLGEDVEKGGEISIKGPIVSNDDVWLYDWLDWDCTAPKNVVLPETGEDIEVHINSGGGDVYAGSEIYTALRSYSGKVVVKIVGIAASAASVIAMAGDVIEISPTAQIMIHNVSSRVDGDHNTLLHEAGVLEGFNKSIADAESAVNQGFADRIMFAGEIAPTFAASETPMIPHDFIDKMKSAMTPDVDKIAELVANKLEARQIAKETFENSEFVQKRFTLPESPENNTNKAVPKGFGLFAF